MVGGLDLLASISMVWMVDAEGRGFPGSFCRGWIESHQLIKTLERTDKPKFEILTFARIPYR
jgi:hypothetical protein